MSADPRVERARRWLRDQLTQLKELRTANTRDPEFKQWRQSTLTVVQRIWPGEAKRSARFRRIPFSPPSTRSEPREVREYYERGCAEAAQFVQAMLEEIDAAGLPAESAAARPASLDPGVAEDDFPTLELPGGASAPGETGGEEPAGGSAAVKRPQVDRRKRSRRGGPRRRLRDMLGLDALQELGRDGEPVAGDAAQPAAVPAAADAGAKDAPAETPRAASRDDDDDAFARDPDEREEPARTLDPGAVTAADEPESSLSADDFLSASPVFKSSGRPVARPQREPSRPAPAPVDDEDLTPKPLSTATAMAVAAIAAEVTRLGVPEGHRARIRASLIHLAEVVDQGALDWKELRGAVESAMEFPPIARRVIPLLIPFLDEAA